MACWLERLAAASPLLVALEDLHWADEASLRLTAFLARRLERRPVLMVLTARIEEIGEAPMLGRMLDELSREQRLTEIALGPLGRSAIGDLVRGLLARRTGETEIESLGGEISEPTIGLLLERGAELETRLVLLPGRSVTALVTDGEGHVRLHGLPAHHASHERRQGGQHRHHQRALPGPAVRQHQVSTL